MKTLCVGGSGFIGSYLMREIKADNIDLVDGWDVRKGIFGKYKVIIFLACNQENTQEAYQYNYEMYLELDKYRRKYPQTRLIYISSVVVLYPGSVYCQTKRLGEVYAKRFKNHLILRLTNVYGHGDGHGAPDNFMRGDKLIFGTGEHIRDLIAVETVVDTIIRFANNHRVGTYQLSSGSGTSVNQMFKMFGSGKPKYIKNKVRVDMDVEKSVVECGWVNYD